MQQLESSGTPVLYRGRTVLKRFIFRVLTFSGNVYWSDISENFSLQIHLSI